MLLLFFKIQEVDNKMKNKIKFTSHPSSFVSKKAHIGTGTKIWNNAQVREKARIGKNCTIGKDVYIDRDVKIGDNCKIQNSVNIYKGVVIGKDVFIGPGVIFTNDFYPRSKVPTKFKKTLVENNVSIGANSTIICGVKIDKNSMIGAGSVVTKDVKKNTLVYGNPAKVKKKNIKF